LCGTQHKDVSASDVCNLEAQPLDDDSDDSLALVNEDLELTVDALPPGTQVKFMLHRCKLTRDRTHPVTYSPFAYPNGCNSLHTRGTRHTRNIYYL